MLLKHLSFCRSKHTSSSKKHSPSVIAELCHQFSLADLRKSTNNFDENRIIKRGVFGIVYIGCLTLNGATDCKTAIKRMTSKSDQWMFKKEIELLCQLHHPNLVSLVGFCDHEDEKIRVYEYMSNGSLYDHLRFEHTEPLSWKKRLEICIGAARGLHYLHTGAKRTILHCDIKPQNILLDDNMVPKLSHLGFSLQVSLFESKPKPVEVEKLIGTIGYMAPECVLTCSFTDKCDVYSFGVVLLELVCTDYKHTVFEKLVMSENQDLQLEDPFFLISPFGDICNYEHRVPVDKIIDPNLIRKIAPECLAVFKDVTKRCLKEGPDERPIMGEVEVELERALALQEEADARNSSGDYGNCYGILEVL